MISPFVFRHAPGATALWANDVACGATVICFGLLSYAQSTRHTHLLSLVVAVWLIAFAYWQGFGAAPPASQNHAIIGLLLAMFAVIPNHASRPGSKWGAAIQAAATTTSRD